MFDDLLNDELGYCKLLKYCDRVDRKEKSVEMRNVYHQKTNVESH